MSQDVEWIGCLSCSHTHERTDTHAQDMIIFVVLFKNDVGKLENYLEVAAAHAFMKLKLQIGWNIIRSPPFCFHTHTCA